jgi:hypothetical protein
MARTFAWKNRSLPSTNAQREAVLRVRPALRKSEEIPESEGCGLGDRGRLARRRNPDVLERHAHLFGNDRELPIFNGTNRATISTYDGWRGSTSGGKFDPNADSFFQPVSFFGAQPTTQFGNETRYNPKLRGWPNFNENFSLARSIAFKEDKRLDFRWETFNLLNRTQFGALSGGATLQNNKLWSVAGAGEFAAPHAAFAEVLLVDAASCAAW